MPVGGMVPKAVVSTLVEASMQLPRGEGNTVRRNRRSRIIASKVWILTHISKEVGPCQVCLPTTTRLATHNKIDALYLSRRDRENYGIWICSTCLYELEQRRQKRQAQYERRLYTAKTHRSVTK